MLSIRLSNRNIKMRKYHVTAIKSHDISHNIMRWMIEIMIFSYAITSSLFSAAFPEVSYILTRLLVALRILIFADAVKIFTKKGVKKKDFYLILIFPFVFILSYYNCSTWELFDAFFIALYIAKIMEYDQVVDMFLYPLLFALGFIILTYFAGMLPIFQVLRVNGTLRFGFGFRHPNDFSRTILFIGFLLCLKWQNYFRLIHAIIVASFAIFVFVFPNSKDASIILLFLLLLIIIWKTMSRRLHCSFFTSRNFKYIIYFFFIFIIAMMWLFLLTHFVDDLLMKFGETFFARFYYGREALNQYGISLLGHDIRFVAEYGIRVLQNTTGYEYFTIDSAYFYLPIARGLISTLFVLWVYFDSINKCFAKRDTLMVFILICMMIYSISEPGLLYFSGSFIFILPRIGDRISSAMYIKKEKSKINQI